MACLINIYSELFPEAEPGGVLTFVGYSPIFPGLPGTGGTTPPLNLQGTIDTSGWLPGFYFFGLTGVCGDFVGSVLQVVESSDCSLNDVHIRICTTDGEITGVWVGGNYFEDPDLVDLLHAFGLYYLIDPLNGYTGSCPAISENYGFELLGWETEFPVDNPIYSDHLDNILDINSIIDLEQINPVYGAHTFSFKHNLIDLVDSEFEWSVSCSNCAGDEAFTVVIDFGCDNPLCDDYPPINGTNKSVCTPCSVNLRESLFGNSSGIITFTGSGTPPPFVEGTNAIEWPPGLYPFNISNGEGDCMQTADATLEVLESINQQDAIIVACKPIATVTEMSVNGVDDTATPGEFELFDFISGDISSVTLESTSCAGTSGCDTGMAAAWDGSSIDLNNSVFTISNNPYIYEFSYDGAAASYDILCGDCIGAQTFYVVINITQDCPPPECWYAGEPIKPAICN